MDIDYKVILGVITIIMVIYGYYAYLRDILKGKTKPHLFTWIIFFILDVISCLVQYNAGAGPGVWGTVTTTIVVFLVVVLTFKFGEKNFTKSDIVSFILALTTVVLYVFLSDPTYSLISLLIIATLAIYPTFRKCYYKPHEETMIMYVLAVLRSLIGIGATASISFLTIGIPIQIIIANTLLITMVCLRRVMLK